MANPEITPELLQAHAGFIRSLARSLLSDEALVDDVVQETYIKALTNGPRQREALTSWLRTVTRNLSFKALRSQGRRRTREEASAKAEGLPSTIDLVARQQSLEQVVGAVKELPDHYQEVVMLRFFEDLPPRHIATRLDLPVNTVRMRLHRALKSLREHLNREYDSDTEWRTSLAILAGLPKPGPVGAGTATTTTVGGLSWLGGLLGALGLMAVLGLGFRMMFGVSPEIQLEAQPEAVVAELAMVAEIEPDIDRPVDPGVRTPSVREPASTVSIPVVDPIPTDLRLRVLEEDGEPVSAAEVLLDWDSSGLLVRGTTDSGGRVDVKLPESTRERLADPKDWRITASARASGHRPSVVDTLPEDVRGEHVIRLRGPGTDLRGRVTNAGGRPIAGATLTVGDEMRLGRGFLGSQLQLFDGYTGRLKIKFIRDVTRPMIFLAFLSGRGYLGDQALTSEASQRRLPPSVKATTDQNGYYILPGLEPGKTSLTVRAKGQGTWRREIVLRTGETETHDVVMKKTVLLRGTATRDDGKPLEGGSVYAIGEDPRERHVARINPRGNFALAGLVGGHYDLFAEAGPRTAPDVSLKKRIFIRSGKSLVWNPVLDDSQRLSGQITGPGSSDGWFLQLALEANPSMAIAEVKSGSDGRFTFPSVPPYPCVLEVRNSIGMATLPIATVRGLTGGKSDVVVELPQSAGSLSPLVGRLLDHKGNPMPPKTQVMVLPRHAPGRTAILLVEGNDGVFTTGPLIHGDYQVLIPDMGLSYTFPRAWRHDGGPTIKEWRMKPLRTLRVEGPPGVDCGSVSISSVVKTDTGELALNLFHGSATFPVELQTSPGLYRLEYPDQPLDANGNVWSRDVTVR